MPPRNVDVTDVVAQTNEENTEEDFNPEQLLPSPSSQDEDSDVGPVKIVWRNVVTFSILHLIALMGVIVLPMSKPQTWLWGFYIYFLGALGITAGAHRLWSHRSYKAKLPLRILLAFFNCIGFQNDIIEWARDHRVHHKYSETNGDPHNARRGFFFAHIGWLLVRKHPDVIKKGKKLDLSDLYLDPVCRIQRKIYKPAVILLCFIMPAYVPYYFWGESFWKAFLVCSILRYCLNLNFTWLVNSAAHIWGMKPYDKNINPSENFFVACAAIGEGYHNYHHTFPHDYATSEYGWVKFNPTTAFIDFMFRIGQAYDLRKVPSETIQLRKERTGDGSDLPRKLHVH